MSYMCFPRLIAVAESGWTRKSEKNYSDFVVRAENQREFLASLGIKQAAKDCWEPSIGERIKIGLDRLKSILNPHAILVFLFPNKNID